MTTGSGSPCFSMPLNVHPAGAFSSNAFAHDNEVSSFSHSSSAALATFNEIFPPVKSEAASSQPLLCPTHITALIGRPPSTVTFSAASTIVSFKWSAVTPSIAATAYNDPMKIVCASFRGGCTSCIAANVSRDRVDALHNTRSGSHHPGPASTTLSHSAAAAERPQTVKGRSWSLRLVSSVQLSECRSTIMRSGCGSDEVAEGSAPEDALGSFPYRTRLGRGRERSVCREVKRASKGVATAVANAVILKGGADPTRMCGDKRARLGNGPYAPSRNPIFEQIFREKVLDMDSADTASSLRQSTRRRGDGRRPKTRSAMSKYNRLLLVIKQTAFASYTTREELARVAGQTLRFDHARMGRLRERHDTHMFQVERITKLLEQRGAKTTSVMRDDVTSKHVGDADLVVALGGDGTTLIASHKLDGANGATPLLGVNTDRASPSDLATLYRSSEPFDMRRSTGHLCACTSDNVEQVLNEVLFGKTEPTKLTRARVDIAGVVLPPVLNDVLIAHPSPGAVSRYSVHVPRVSDAAEEEEEIDLSDRTNNLIDPLWFHVRSSGLRVCTAAGSTAAMRSAGGEPMHYSSRNLQFMDREPIYFDHAPPPSSGHGFYGQNETMRLRWNSRAGTVFLDGAHVTHDVQMGDRIEISTDAPELRLFTSAWFRRNHSNMWLDRKENLRHGGTNDAELLLGDRDWIVDGS